MKYSIKSFLVGESLIESFSIVISRLLLAKRKLHLGCSIQVNRRLNKDVFRSDVCFNSLCTDQINWFLVLIGWEKVQPMNSKAKC